MLVDLLDSKTALFFLAFLPGFVERGHGPVALQVVVLGGCFVALATLTDGACAVAAARISRRVRTSRLAAAGAGTYGVLGVVALAGGCDPRSDRAAPPRQPHRNRGGRSI